ncbi:hypothetical protein NFI96_022239, partial [Prochilodus magdalenae]
MKEQTTIYDPRFKKLAFNENRVVDAALQRIPAATAAITCRQESKMEKRTQGMNKRNHKHLLFEAACGEKCRPTGRPLCIVATSVPSERIFPKHGRSLQKGEIGSAPRDEVLGFFKYQSSLKTCKACHLYA